MRYRTGRHNHRIVYRQLTDNPSDEDVMLAVFFDAIDAMAVVSMLNGDEDDALWADDPLARPVEGSAPLESPAPDMRSRRQGGRGAAAGYDPADEPAPRPCAAVFWPSGSTLLRAGDAYRFGACVLSEHKTTRGYAELYTEHRDEHGNEWTSGAPVDETVSVPPPVDGLYGKFRVARVDGRDKPGGDKASARYFVLDYAQDPHARPALAAYADACARELPRLAADLRAELGSQPADGPVVEPLPVDALLDLVDDLHGAVRDDDGNAVDRARGNIVMAARDLWVAGVAEGRRHAEQERTEEKIAPEHILTAISVLNTFAEDEREPDRYRDGFQAAAEALRGLLSAEPEEQIHG